MKTTLKISIGMAIVATSALIVTRALRTFSTTDPSKLYIDSSGGEVTITPDGWNFHIGGSGGYARISYLVPENDGRVFTEFYEKAVVVIPDNFYSTPRNGFRIINTDNFTTTLNGANVGAKDENELRVGLYIWKSDNLLHFIYEHETIKGVELWRSTSPLPVGKHTIEMYGDVSKIAPWYLRIDGIIVAHGTAKLCTPEMSQSECVVTRLRAGMDGAAGSGANMDLQIKSLTVSDHDLSWHD